MKNTNIKMRNLIIYQIYVRNFSEKGNFAAVIDELDRIKDLGVDIVYLLPIHPIGLIGRKGKLGCPYSIKDYLSVAEELGTMDDFQNLINAVHERKMKIMMDIVFNHTSRDSVLLEQHPEYFLRDDFGKLMSKAGEWTDVADLDYTSDKGLWSELISVLEFYSRIGVDGYRADVASVVPLDFWKQARKAVNRINRSTFWLSESIHGGFLKYLRDLGYEGYCEAEMYQVFDMAYDYDIEPYFKSYILGERPLKDYLEVIKKQDEIYPGNYVKMKNLENHDQPRIAGLVDNDPDKIKNWTAFNFFQKGAVLLYAGEEFSSDITPSLFEKDVFPRKQDITEYIQRLIRLKKQRIFASGVFTINIPKIDGVAYNIVEDSKKLYHGIFNLASVEGELEVSLPDGNYRNTLTGKIVKVANQKIMLINDPIIIKMKK